MSHAHIELRNINQSYDRSGGGKDQVQARIDSMLRAACRGHGRQGRSDTLPSGVALAHASTASAVPSAGKERARTSARQSTLN